MFEVDQIMSHTKNIKLTKNKCMYKSNANTVFLRHKLHAANSCVYAPPELHHQNYCLFSPPWSILPTHSLPLNNPKPQPLETFSHVCLSVCLSFPLSLSLRLFANIATLVNGANPLNYLFAFETPVQKRIACVAPNV
jgi:hypothetical protein